MSQKIINPDHRSFVQLAYIIEKFPSPTEYFILNEIIELEKHGVELNLLVLRKQKKYLNLKEIKDLKSMIIYLPRIYYYFPFISFFISPSSVFLPKSIGILLSILKRYSYNMKVIRNYFISLFFTRKLKSKPISHIHAHFAFVSSDIALILSKLMGIKYSLTAHANDIYAKNDTIKLKIREASFIITCTKYNRNYLNKLTSFNYEGKIHTVYHGIDISKWTPDIHHKRSDSNVIHLLSIARLVEKKGLIYLLEAVNVLIKNGTKVRSTIIGEGPLKKQLENYIDDNKLNDFIRIHDFTSQDEIKKHYLNADIFVLPCIIAKNGDMDGLPNVIAESLAMGVPVVTTNISAIPELIENENTGLLVPEKNALAIVDAVLKLSYNPELYRNIALNGKVKVKTGFSLLKSNQHIMHLFENKDFK